MRGKVSQKRYRTPNWFRSKANCLKLNAVVRYWSAKTVVVHTHGNADGCENTGWFPTAICRIASILLITVTRITKSARCGKGLNWHARSNGGMVHKVPEPLL